MESFTEEPKFNIQSVIEQKPFENPAVEAFFRKWCGANDHIEPEVISRDKWELVSRGGGILTEKWGPDNKQTLYIPKDLQLWEMIGVIETVDNDTFATNRKESGAAKEELITLGKTFEDAGTYIAERIDRIHNGKEIAKALALEFYEYGKKLVSGKRLDEDIHFEEIAKASLSPEATENIDYFLAGKSLYESRKKRAEKTLGVDESKKEEIYEKERQKTLTQFFRVAEEAFKLKAENHDSNGKLSNGKAGRHPWQSNAPIHNAFLSKVERAITKQIEIPKRELMDSVFRRGMELLKQHMPIDELPAEVKNLIFFGLARVIHLVKH